MAEDMERAKRVIAEAFEAFNRGDFDAAIEHAHPEIEWRGALEVEAPLAGKEAVRASLDPVIWDEQRIEINSMEAIGNSLLVDATFHATGSSSGIALNNDGFHVWKIRDGLACRFEFFADRDEAVAAAREAEGLPPAA